MDVLSIWSRAQSELASGKTPDDVIQKPQVKPQAVDTPAGDSDTPERLGELARQHMRRFEHQRMCDEIELGAVDFILWLPQSASKRATAAALGHLDLAIKNQQAAVDLTPAGDTNKWERLDQLRRLFTRRLQCAEALEDLDRTIEDQQAVVDLTPSNEPEHVSQLARFLMLRFERQGTLYDLQGAIKNQQAAVDRTPAGDSDMPERLSELSRLLVHRFEHQGMLDAAINYQRGAVDLTPAGSDETEWFRTFERLLQSPCKRRTTLGDLDWAIKNQQAAVDLTPTGDSNQLERLNVVVGLLMRRFEGKGHIEDLDRAIKNQQAVVDLTLAGDKDKPERLDVLGGLLMRRFEIQGSLEDLDGAIWIRRAGAVLAPADNESRPERLDYLETLLERRLQTVGDTDIETWSSLRALITLPATLGGAKDLDEIIKDKLVEDLQQLSICIKKSKHRELAANLRRMEHAILCLKFQDGDKLCQDVFRASTRLGAYCQALRNRAGDKINQKELEDLYKEFVRIEREFSAAHDLINSKYEQLYKQWKAERQSLSRFLSKAEPIMMQGSNQEVRALVEQVDAGFEKMRNALKSEANDLKNFSDSLNGFSKLVHLSPDPPQPPDPPSSPSEVSTQVDDVIETLSKVDTLVKKSRYTKARQIVSKTSSKTTQKLKKLRTSSEDYEEESRTLSCLRTRHHNDNSRDIRKRQRELCGQLSNLVCGMRKMLKGIEKGFSGCKASIQGLVFRPLGDLLCDLESYLPQAGLELSSKGLHPDLILYEAAFQAIADSIPAQSALLERINGCLSMVDKLKGV